MADGSELRWHQNQEACYLGLWPMPIVSTLEDRPFSADRAVVSTKPSKIVPGTETI
jgi:hypothetical protein